MVEGKRPVGTRVVVYDAEGYFVAPGIAEFLALEGYEVELVTCLDQIAPVCDRTIEGPLLRKRLHDRGIVLQRAVTITGIEEHRVTGLGEFDEPAHYETSGIVLVTQRLSDDALYHEVAADPSLLERCGIVGLYRIGDCVAPRIPADAIFDGHRLGREIDSEAPGTPLPYRRERATVGKLGFSI